LWGVGPENFREVDAKMTDNQLHNDFLAFFVERGLVGALGLGLLAFFAAGRAGYMVFLAHKYPDQNQLTVVVFLAAIAAIGVESLTHQVFHFRALWLVLALQEAMLYQMKMAESERVPTARALGETPDYVRGFVVRPDISGG
jgi:O-antigen ligase